VRHVRSLRRCLETSLRLNHNRLPWTYPTASLTGPITAKRN
jgi:hypothetical protein